MLLKLKAYHPDWTLTILIFIKLQNQTKINRENHHDMQKRKNIAYHTSLPLRTLHA